MDICGIYKVLINYVSEWICTELKDGITFLSAKCQPDINNLVSPVVRFVVVTNDYFFSLQFASIVHRKSF